MTKIKVLVAMWFSIAGCASLAEERINDAPIPPEKSELIGSAVTLPLDAGAPRPTIKAKINGKGPFEFVLDTGAQGFVINADLAKELKLPVVGKSAMGDPSDPLAIEVDRVRIETVEIGGVLLSGVIADSWDPPAGMSGHLRGRGIFGLYMLSEFLVTFDYGAGEIRVERGALPAANGGDVLEWRIIGEGLPSLKLNVGGITLDAHIDSGAPGELTLPDKVRRQLKFTSEPVVIGRGRTVNSEFEIRRGTLDGQVKLGAHLFKNPELSFVTMLDSSGYANIGSGILRDFVITYDQENGRVRFVKGKKTQAAKTGSCGSFSG